MPYATKTNTPSTTNQATEAARESANTAAVVMLGLNSLRYLLSTTPIGSKRQIGIELDRAFEADGTTIRDHLEGLWASRSALRSSQEASLKIPLSEIEDLVGQAIKQAGESGANSRSTPNEYVAIAHFVSFPEQYGLRPRQPRTSESPEVEAQEIGWQPTWEHAANEWGDTATSALQWLRNIAEGISDVETAIRNTEDGVAHCQRVVREVRELTTAQQVAPSARPTDDKLWDQTLRERDNYHQWADNLAGAIAKLLGVEIGEHSNINNPWAEALGAVIDAQEKTSAGHALGNEHGDNAPLRWISEADFEWLAKFTNVGVAQVNLLNEGGGKRVPLYAGEPAKDTVLVAALQEISKEYGPHTDAGRTAFRALASYGGPNPLIAEKGGA